VTHALALLRAVEEGTPSGAHVDALVSAVLDAPRVALARRIRDGAPLRMRLAIELAAMVLDACAEGGSKQGGG
jgi:hypothetical protein